MPTVRIEAMNMLMEILENPNAESTKEKIDILTGSADEMVQNPKYRDLVKNMKSVLANLIK